MAAESFFRRWARLKSDGNAESAAAPAQDQATGNEIATSTSGARRAADSPEKPLPTLDDVARLTADSDYSAFVAQGVDKSVQRMAMKKLFSDPHFNVMDRLDIYIDDYNKPDPVSAAMLASLKHAENFLGMAPAAQDECARPPIAVDEVRESRLEEPDASADCSAPSIEDTQPASPVEAPHQEQHQSRPERGDEPL
jgi:hypothetical protein